MAPIGKAQRRVPTPVHGARRGSSGAFFSGHSTPGPLSEKSLSFLNPVGFGEYVLRPATNGWSSAGATLLLTFLERSPQAAAPRASAEKAAFLPNTGLMPQPSSSGYWRYSATCRAD